MKVKELKQKCWRDMKDGRILERFNMCLIIALIIGVAFFDVNVLLCFIIGNICWFSFAFSVYTITKNEVFLKFLNRFDNDDEFPDDF